MNDFLDSQFDAALAMMRTTIGKFPDDLWTDPRFGNPAWRIAYHALYYVHLYLAPTEGEFQPWSLALDNGHFLRAPLGEGDLPHSRASVLEYLEIVAAAVPVGLAARGPMESSGFDWISMKRGELHIYNLRHLQHHTGQLIERLRAETGEGVDWVGRKY